MREAYPRELFKSLEKYGIIVSEKYEGIYYLEGNTTFNTQIIVTKRLDGQKHVVLKILSRKARENDVKRFLQEARDVQDAGERQNVDAVLQVSVRENKKLYRKLDRRNWDMFEYLMDIFKEDIEEEKEKACAEKTVFLVRNLMKNLDCSADQALKALGISDEEQKKITSLL